MATVLHFHGFASSGTSEKSQALIDTFGKDHTVISPDLPFSPAQVIELVTDIALRVRDFPLVLVGTSLGGFWANYFAQKFDAPCVIVNPSTDPAFSLKSRVGQTVKNYATGVDIQVTQADLELFKQLRADTEKIQNGALVNLFVAKDDDVIDHTVPLAVFKHTKTTVVTEDGGHRFAANWPLVIDCITQLIKD